jgi:hypothetical protein
VGIRQGACGKPECQATRRDKAQAVWRKANPDYFSGRRIQARGALSRAPDPMRPPAPLSKLPWNIAQDEFGVKGAAFIGLMGKTLLVAAQDQLRAAQDEIAAHRTEKTWVVGKTPLHVTVFLCCSSPSGRLSKIGV